MKKIVPIASIFLLLPLVSYAQGTFQSFLTNLVTFLSGTVIPFLLGVAFLFFVINAIRYFVVGGSSEEGREKAKYLAIYGLLAFVLIITFWGLVNLLVNSTGVGGKKQPDSDYVKMKSTP